MARNQETFTKLLLDALTEHSEPIFSKHRKELGEAIHNDLFDLEGPREIGREHAPIDYFVGELFRGFVEITESFNTLEDIALYIRRFPFAETRATKERYLQFHVECYYSENYVLRERLKAYLKFIGRRFKKDPSISQLQETCKKLEDLTSEALKGVTDVRSQHVHRARLSDKAIDRMKMVSLLATSPDQVMREAMTKYHSELHREVKAKWVGTMKSNNATIGKLLHAFFGALEPVVFDLKTRKLRRPQHLEA